MQEFRCPYCGQAAFSTVCTDCQAEGIPIRKVQSVFHIGRCPRCGHLDDEPCGARVGVNKAVSRVLRGAGRALGEFGSQVLKLAMRAAETIRGGTVRTR